MKSHHLLALSLFAAPMLWAENPATPAPVPTPAAPLPAALPPLHVREFIVMGDFDDVGNAILAPNAAQKELRAEMEQVLEHYRRTGDARYASPRYRVTMLHLAALMHDGALIDELLAKGASVNARMLTAYTLEADDGTETRGYEPCDTPLTLALLNLTQAPATAAQVKPIVETLLAAGASPAITGWDGEDVLGCCIEGAGTGEGRADWEDIALLLLDKGAAPDSTDALAAMEAGWTRAFAAMLKGPHGGELRASEGIRHRLLNYFHPYNDSMVADSREGNAMLACARAFFTSKGQMDEPQRRTDLSSALLKLSEPLSEYESLPFVSKAYTEFIALLLGEGADARWSDYKHASCCAADFIACCPELQAQLAELGYDVTPPPHRFDKAYDLQSMLSFLPLAAVRDEEVRGQWDVLARLLSPEGQTYRRPARKGRSAYWGAADPLATAFRLLYRADAERARQLVMKDPRWLDPAMWQEGSDNFPEQMLMLNTLRRSPEALFPTAWLADVLQVAVDAGCFYEAGSLLRIAAREATPEAEALIDGYCASTSGMLRGAAWEAKLKLHNLPSAHGRQLELYMVDSYEIAPADLAPEHVVALRAAWAMQLFDDEELPRVVDTFASLCKDDADIIAALESIGAPRAAKVYEREYIDLREDCGGDGADAGVWQEAGREDGEEYDEEDDEEDEEEDEEDSGWLDDNGEERHDVEDDEEDGVMEATYELEEAFGKYLIKHEQLFKHPAKAVFRAVIPLPRPVRD